MGRDGTPIPGGAGRTLKKVDRWLIGLGFPCLIGLGIGVLHHIDPLSGGQLVPCWFHCLTGRYCIGCGTTRAFAALLQGDLVSALSYNAFVVIWMVWPAIFALELWLHAVTGRRILPVPRESRLILMSLLTSAVLFFVFRNLPWMPFRWLAP
jgi:hypothetical protein